MSKNLPSEELSWEEAVSKFLEANPDYFDHHPDVLAALTIPHAETGRAVSLIERQVQVLRDKNTALQQQLRELLAIARENDVIGERLHRFACAMIDSASLEDAIGTAEDLLRQDFKLDQVVIRLRGEGLTEGRPESVAPGDRQFLGLMQQFEGKRVVCGAKHDRSVLQYLFADHGKEIRSTAFVALKDSRREGFLCLGSHDPHRFHPEMGTVYLLRLGELLMRGVGRY